ARYMRPDALIVWLVLAALAVRGARLAPGAAGASCRLDDLAGCAPGPLLAEFFGVGHWRLDARVVAPAGGALALVGPAEFARLASGSPFDAAWPCGSAFYECERAGVAADGPFYVALQTNGSATGWVRVEAAGAGWAAFAACAAAAGAVVVLCLVCFCSRRRNRPARAADRRSGDLELLLLAPREPAPQAGQK
ncbi:MAG TPA: hypothetical protein VNI01_06060, partial [Elusimicrobiota bacterium]|nr:hypothetical protein [Elusimicrobiota bacterium]